MSADPQSPETTAEGATPETAAAVVEPEGTEEPASAEPETTAEPKTEPAEPAWADDLVARAKEYGIENPQSLGTPDQLQAVMARIDGRYAKLAQQLQQPRDEATPDTKPSPAVSPRGETGPPEPAFKGFESKFTDEQKEELGTDLIGHLADMTNHYNTSSAALHQRVATLEQHLAQANQMLTIQWLDNEFASLGPEWQGFIGSGPSLELPRDGDALKHRVAIEQMARNVAASDALRSGGQPGWPTRSQLLRGAFAVAAEHDFNPKAKQIAAAITKRAASAIPRPTETKTPEPVELGEAAQIAETAEWLKQHGRK